MINAIAIDDEPLALEVIAFFAEKNENIQLLATFQQLAAASVFLSENQVDLIFLDIEMPSKNGLQYYKQLVYQPLVIFTTAYSQYAVEGFNVNAVDYLLKPFTQERFDQAVEKTLFYLDKYKKVKPSNAILIKSDSKLHKIVAEEIEWIEALDNYIKIRLQDKKTIVARYTMKNIMQDLPADKFVRIHKSYIVAISKINSVENKQLFIGDTAFPVGDIYKNDLQRLLQS